MIPHPIRFDSNECLLLPSLKHAKKYSCWKVKDARAVRLIDAKLAYLIIAASFHCTVLVQEESLMAAARYLDDM